MEEAMATAIGKTSNDVFCDVMQGLFSKLSLRDRSLVMTFLIGHVAMNGESLEKLYAGLLIERLFENHPGLKTTYYELADSK
jgi:hypothetical protein